MVTFDWGQITAFTGSPLPTPWWSAANTGIALLIFSWFLVPLLYVSFYFCFGYFLMTFPQYTNTWYSAFLPIVSSQAFDNTASPYNVTRIITEDLTLNVDAYKAYSPLFISVTFAMSYGLSFGAISSTLTHIFLYHRKQLMNQARRSLAEQPDVHARLMSVYKEVPIWWYLALFSKSISKARRVHVFTAFVGTMFGFGIAVIEIWHTQFPIWAFILALIIGASPIPHIDYILS